MDEKVDIEVKSPLNNTTNIEGASTTDDTRYKANTLKLKKKKNLENVMLPAAYN